MNDSKYVLAESSVALEDDSIIILKKSLDYFFEKFDSSTSFQNRMKSLSSFLIEFELVINNYPNKKQRLVRYALKSLNHFLKTPVIIKHRKLIFELSLYIFNFSSEYYSSRTFYTFFLKYRELLKKEYKESALLGEVEEEIFQFMLKGLRQNSDNFKQIYDLLVSMKFFDKKISPAILCSLIEKHKHDYFSLCAISLYILDDKQRVAKEYLIVLKKIMNQLTTYIEFYKTKSIYKYQDATYFYLINDFYHYPGFKNSNLSKGFKMLIKDKHNELRNDLQSIYGADTQILLGNSYFSWKCDFQWFFKQSLLKSENTSMNDINSDY
ncbi:Uncharacterised protein [Lysinibacillus sphaericus]|nr:Uncharacterised protein [Lysinibacillus sphaericus]